MSYESRKKSGNNAEAVVASLLRNRGEAIKFRGIDARLNRNPFLFIHYTNETHRYYPDFYLPDKKLYVEVKSVGSRYTTLERDEYLQIGSIAQKRPASVWYAFLGCWEGCYSVRWVRYEDIQPLLAADDPDNKLPSDSTGVWRLPTGAVGRGSGLPFLVVCWASTPYTEINIEN